MITIIDGPQGKDDWAVMDWDTGEITYDESGVKKLLETKDILFVRGKYEGSLLSEVSDSWYLKFIKDKNPDDHFIQFAFNKRIAELSL